ncbi:hypothetical protein JKA74_14065 [Marivirga sp. S37H4]|uniref:Uncharacterized protein n=1 Tax=Marivirga aurantiaca TaxID=2802615 RepID=A0A934X0B8_9BACT|nr:hypothetical protein [Marivirga aurantiaca]MBK6266166.1 hypothetical protein [Marivirga aurantiaca]
MNGNNKLLIAGGILSAIASLLHILIIIGGPDWYRFFGAGEGMAQLAESGSYHPVFTTAFIALVLAIWALYAFSAATGKFSLPFKKAVLFIIAFIFLFRAFTAIPAVILIDDPYLNELEARLTFMIVSSVFCLVIGLLYLLGTMRWIKSDIQLSRKKK